MFENCLPKATKKKETQHWHAGTGPKDEHVQKQPCGGWGGGRGRRWDVSWTRHNRWARDVPALRLPGLPIGRPAIQSAEAHVMQPAGWSPANEACPQGRRLATESTEAHLMQPAVVLCWCPAVARPSHWEARQRIRRSALDALSRGAVLVHCGCQACPERGCLPIGRLASKSTEAHLMQPAGAVLVPYGSQACPDGSSPANPQRQLD